MNPLLRSDFEQIDKNNIKKFRRKIIQNIALIRKKSLNKDYYSLHNFAYLHILFSLIFLLFPFVSIAYKFHELINNHKNNFLNNFFEEKFFKDKNINFVLNNFTSLYQEDYKFKDFVINKELENTNKFKIKVFAVNALGK